MPRPRSLSFLFIFLFGLALTPAARAEWVVDGVPVCTAWGVQLSQGIVSNGSGGAIVFWVDGRDLQNDLYAQQVTADGAIAPGWQLNGFRFGTGNVGVLNPIGIPDGVGGAIIVWEDDRAISTSRINIYAQRITADGTIAPGWPADGFPVCTAPGDQMDPQLVSDGAGGAIVTWTDYRNDPTHPDIYAQRITADGNIAPGWPVDGMPICIDPETQGIPSLAGDGAGGAIIAWTDGRTFSTTGGDIYAQRITPSGEIAPGWATGGIPICTAEGNQFRTEAVTDAEGGGVIMWRDARSRPGSIEEGYEDIYAQRIRGDASFAPGWPENGVPLCRAPETQQFLSAAPDGLGGAIVAWEDYRSYSFPISTASDIYAQRVTAEGVIPEGWPADGIGVCTVPGFQLNPKLAADDTAGAYIVWEDTRSGNEDVYAQHVTASGQVASGWSPNGIPICTRPTSQPGPVIAPDGFGGAITAWNDLRNGNKDIFAQKLGIDGPVAALATLVSAQAVPGQVILTWFSADPSQLGTVYRRTETSDWMPVGSPHLDGEHYLVFVDLGLEAGRYAYRLGLRGPEGEQFTSEIWVEVPSQLVLSLSGFRPNPARGGNFVIAFSLPTSERATIEVISVTGRTVLSREVGSLGPGNHLLKLNDGAALSPGVYWLRLIQTGRTLVTKAVVAS